jgi:hypothetical protein
MRSRPSLAPPSWAWYRFPTTNSYLIRHHRFVLEQNSNYASFARDTRHTTNRRSHKNELLTPLLDEAEPNLTISDPIVVQKSTFVARACLIQHPSQVPIVLRSIMQDKRAARAAHPVIHAWRCTVDGVSMQG